MIAINRLLATFLMSSMLALGAATAADRDEPSAEADATFKALDRDSDQRLSKSEVAEDRTLTKVFASIDVDGDGYLTQREYTANLKQRRSPKEE